MRFRAVTAFTATAFLLIPAMLSASAFLSPSVQRAVERKQFNADSLVTVVVFLESAESSSKIHLLGDDEHLTRGQRIRSVTRNVRNQRGRGQSTVESFLKRNAAKPVEKHWIVPAYTVTIPVSAIAELESLDGVQEIIENVALSFDEPVESTPAAALSTAVSTQHEMLNIDDLWARGLKGQGRLICSFDTGVEEGHPALVSKWRGNHVDLHAAWFSKVAPDTLPSDKAGHGTHTMGIMVGSSGADTVGVAPGAEWITAGVIDQGRPLGTTISDIIQAFEWALDPDGDPNTTDDVPDVILNSWGIPKGLFSPCDAAFWTAIDNVEAAGIVTIFAAGNEGPNPRTLRSPADRATTPYNSFAIGAVDDNMVVASFSSRGPSSCDTTGIKPEAVAPGIAIRSCYKGGGYQIMSGTSMAAPFIAGMVALMRQYNPDATVAQIKQALALSCRDLGPFGKDNSYGFGLPNGATVLSYLPVPASANFSLVGSSISDDGIATPGEQILLNVTLNNPSGNVENLASRLLSRDTSAARVISASASFAFGIGGTTAINLLPFQLLVDSLTPNGVKIPLSLELLGPGSIPFDTLDFEITAGITPNGTIAEHITDRLELTISDFGQFGLAPHSCYHAGGAGFRYESGNNLLYEAGIIVGRNSVQLSSSVRGSNGRFNGSDFVPSNPLLAGFTADGGASYQCELDDAGSAVSIPISIRQKTVSYNTSGDDGMVIFSFYLKNQSLEKLTNLRFGFLTDFDLGAGEQVQFNSDMNLLYQQKGSTFVGLLGLANINGFQALENGSQKRGFTNTEKMNLISFQGVATNGITNDAMMLLSAGPFSIMPLDSVLVSFAIVGGNSLNDLSENAAAARNRSDAPTGTNGGDGSLLPGEFALNQNYPNPFNPSTTIQFTLPAHAQVSLEIYNLLGQRVKKLQDGELPAGTHTREWNGTNDDNATVATGVYFYRLTSPGFSETKQMILMK